MRALSLSFSTVDLNVAYASSVKKVAYLDILENVFQGTVTGDTKRAYARGLQIVNTAGVAIELAIISEYVDGAGKTEEAVFDADPTNFGWVLIPASGTLTLNRVPKAYKISLRSVTGAGATAAVRVDLFPLYRDKNV